MMMGVLCVLNGQIDGDVLGWWWGEMLCQYVFCLFLVFNFYLLDYFVLGMQLMGGVFGIYNVNMVLEWLNYLIYLIDWGGFKLVVGVFNVIGISVMLDGFDVDVVDVVRFVDCLFLLVYGELLFDVLCVKVLDVVLWWMVKMDVKNWQCNCVKVVVYLVFVVFQYQIVC